MKPLSNFKVTSQVADKLFSSFGQDILDSLFWTATESCTKKRHYFIVLLHLILAIIYVCILFNMCLVYVNYYDEKTSAMLG